MSTADYMIYVYEDQLKDDLVAEMIGEICVKGHDE